MKKIYATCLPAVSHNYMLIISKFLFNIITFTNILYQSELQLKPNHVPFRLTCQWDELLEKYTTAEKEDIERGTSIVNQKVFMKVIY